HTYRLLIVKEHPREAPCFFASSATREANFEPPDTQRQEESEKYFSIVTSHSRDEPLTKINESGSNDSRDKRTQKIPRISIRLSVALVVANCAGQFDTRLNL
ncbi:hypothetical protein, partial [Paraburkholderia hospita]